MIVRALLLACVAAVAGPFAQAAGVLVPPSAVDPAGLRVIEMVRVGGRLVGPGEVESDYRLTLRHDGRQPLAEVRVHVDAAGPGTSVAGGTVAVERVLPGQTVWPGGIVRIRHAAWQAPGAGALAWRFELRQVPARAAQFVEGDPGLRAVQALPSFAADADARAARVMRDPESGEEYFARLIEAEIAPAASVAQVNDALRLAGAALKHSRQGDPVVTLVLPSASNLPSLMAAARRLESTGAFAWAVPMLQARPQALPAGVLPRDATGDRGAVRHHAAVRLPAVWGLADSAGATDVELIVVDYFGKGTVGEFSAPVVGIGSGNDCGRDCEHGYHVLGIAAASFGATADAFGKVTGASASAPRAIHVIDLASRGPLADTDFIRQRLGEIVAGSPDARFVVNLSLGYRSDQVSAARAGRAWVRLLAGVKPPGAAAYDLPSRMLQVSAAGNGGAASTARLRSPYNAAALMTAAELGVAPLPHALVVENRVAVSNVAGSVVSPGCPAPSSSLGGHVGAIGSGVLSYTGTSADAVGATGFKTGTSMATPQVAGLAVQLLALSPAEPLQGIARRIVDTARPVALPCAAPGAPVVDALAAALALDAPGAPRLRSALLRRGALPAAGFSAADAIDLAERLFADRAARRPAYGDADLNGDGPVDGPTSGPGAPTRAPFDLDGRGEGAARYAAAVSPAEPTAPFSPGRPPLVWDERAVSDFDVLCWHLRSPLFEPDAAPTERQVRRNAALAPLLAASLRLGRVIDCGAIQVDAPYVLEMTTTATTTAPTVSRTVACPGGPCRADLFCRPDSELGETQRYRLGLRLDSSTRLVRLDFGADGALEGEGFDALDLAAGRAGVVRIADSGSERVPPQPGWVLDYFSDWDERFDLRYDAATGVLTGTLVAVTQTRWSAGPEVARCTATSEVRLRPRR